ncbi:hypothetical protein NYE69_08540 [Paenibacillus sp. FSL R5-0527]
MSREQPKLSDKPLKERVDVFRLHRGLKSLLHLTVTADQKL